MYSEEKIIDFKFGGKNKSAAKVLLRVVPKVGMLYYMYKLIVHIRLSRRNVHKPMSGETTL